MAGKNLNGQGSVYQRKQDGMWIGAAYVLTTTGHRKRITVSSRDPDEARKALTRKIADSDAGIPVAAQTWTVAQYLAYWLEHIVKPRRPKTYQGYEGVVRRYLTPILGRKKLHRLTAPDVKMMMTRLRTECRCCADGIDAAREEKAQKCCAKGKCCHQVLSVRTVQFVHAVLRNALQNAVREEMIPRNVAKLVQVETPRYRINRGLSLEQAKHLLTAAKDDRLQRSTSWRSTSACAAPSCSGSGGSTSTSRRAPSRSSRRCSGSRAGSSSCRRRRTARHGRSRSSRPPPRR
jgi:hypothetical protein